MSARSRIDPDQLRAAAMDPANRLDDLARIFQVSRNTICVRLAELGIKKPRAGDHGGPPVGTTFLKPDEPGILGYDARQAELRELEPWPAGIWFGPGRAA